MHIQDVTALTVISCNLKKYRQKKYPGRGGLTVCAERFGISAQYWRDWETGKRTPGTRNQLKLAEFFGVTIGELAGTEEASERESAPPASPPVKSIPVLGLGECGISGWHTVRPVAIRASLSLHDEAFAVVAVGTSMIPDGIQEGNLLYCDPSVQPQEGDAVFIKTRDGRVTIKRFVKRDESWLRVLGWLDPDTHGNQKPYTYELSTDFIDTVHCIVIVQRRV